MTMKDETNQCRKCGYKHDAFTGVKNENSKPSPGSFSLCAECGEISKFSSDLKLVPVTPEDLVALNDADPDMFDEIMRVRFRLRQIGGISAFRK